MAEGGSRATAALPRDEEIVKLVSFDIPKSDDQLALWLDRMLCGKALQQLVVELQGIGRLREANEVIAILTLDDVLADRNAELLKSGCAALDRIQIRRLLQRPELLLELQAYVFSNGSKFWQERFLTFDSSEMPQSNRTHLALFLGPEAAQLLGARDGKAAARGSFKKLITIAVVAGIGIGLIFAFVGPTLKSTFTADSQTSVDLHRWGWQNVDQIPNDLEPEEYFAELALLAKQWYTDVPADRNALNTRLEELEQGCRTLAARVSPELPKADRDVLVRKLESWSSQSATIRSSKLDFEKAYADANKLNVDIMDHLQRKAAGQ